MTLLTKKVADEVGKTVDHVNQVDEVSAHSDEVNPRRTEADGVASNEPSQVDGNSPSLAGLDEATVDSLNRSLDGFTPVQKNQYIDVIASDISKGQKLLEFGNFGSPERFRNVLNALDSVDDVGRLKRVFDEDYLNSLVDQINPGDTNMKTRYQQLLNDVADKNISPAAFKERLSTLEKIKKVQDAVENKVSTEAYRTHLVSL